MFSRVAASGIAAFLLVMPAVSSGETSAPADTDGPAAPIAIATLEQPQQRVQDRPQQSDNGPTSDQVQEQPQEAPQQQADDPVQDQVLEQAQDQRQKEADDPTPNRVQERTVDDTQILLRDPPNDDSAAQAKLAALEPTEPLPPAPSPDVLEKPAIQAPANADPFGVRELPVVSGEILTKWSGVEADIRAEQDIFARCRANAQHCPYPARNFLAIVAQGRAQTGRARIGVINRAINLAIIPTSDLAQWGVIDRWSAPLETFSTGRGDCEDYAIAKYVALTEAGVAAEDVRLVIVRNLAANEDHAVVAVRLDGDWIILDNRWLTMVEDTAMREVAPLFVLDQSGVREFSPAAMPLASRAAPASLPHSSPIKVQRSAIALIAARWGAEASDLFETTFASPTIRMTPPAIAVII